MQPIAIAASPLTYTEYRKLSLTDFRVRYPFYYIGLPAITLLPLVVLAAVVAMDVTSSIEQSPPNTGEKSQSHQTRWISCVADFSK